MLENTDTDHSKLNFEYLDKSGVRTLQILHCLLIYDLLNSKLTNKLNTDMFIYQVQNLTILKEMVVESNHIKDSKGKFTHNSTSYMNLMMQLMKK
jgi:hypothetical protein